MHKFIKWPLFIVLTGILLIGIKQFHYYFSYNGNIIFLVSNQASNLDSVDISIELDGKKIVADTYTIGNHHSYKLYSYKVPIGNHDLTIKSSKGKTHTKKEISLLFVSWVKVEYFDFDIVIQKEDKYSPFFVVEKTIMPIVIQ